MFFPSACLPAAPSPTPQGLPAPPPSQGAHREPAPRPASAEASEAASARLRALAKLVHELRTPLGGVLGMARLMAHAGPLNPAQRRQLSLIEDCGQHLLQLVSDILDFARLDARQIQLHPRPTCLRALLTDTLEIMAPMARERALALALALPDGLPARLQVDALRLRQVLLNLLSNAIRYTARGGVDLTVERLDGGPSASRRCLLRFNVVDTGPGLDAEALVRLDQLFHRPREGPDLPDGSGVGLAVTRELVALMGGELSLRSSPGRGTVVSFTLAAEVSPPEAPGGAAPPG